MIEISNDEYRKKEGISSSEIKDWVSAVSPAHWLEKQGKNWDSDAFRFGRVFHAMVLENLEPKVFHAPINQKTGKAFGSTSLKYEKAFDEFKAENGADFLTVSEFGKAQVMAKSCKKVASHILEGIGYNERSFFTEDKETGVVLKCRPDRIKGKYLVDLKTCASIGEFEKSITKYLYHVQAAFYLDVFEQNMDMKMNGFIFIAVEKQAPYDSGVFVLSGDFLEIGRLQYRKALEEMIDCKATGNYRGIMNGEEQIVIDAPNWLYKKYLEEK